MTTWDSDVSAEPAAGDCSRTVPGGAVPVMRVLASTVRPFFAASSARPRSIVPSAYGRPTSSGMIELEDAADVFSFVGHWSLSLTNRADSPQLVSVTQAARPY